VAINWVSSRLSMHRHMVDTSMKDGEGINNLFSSFLAVDLAHSLRSTVCVRRDPKTPGRLSES